MAVALPLITQPGLPSSLEKPVPLFNPQSLNDKPITMFCERLKTKPQMDEINRAVHCFVRGLLTLSMLLLGNSCTILACSDAEREVLTEFPLYGDVEVNAEGNVETGACAVYYQVHDSSDQVRSYFVEQLTQHGWTVETEPAAGLLVSAQRGQFSYVVYYEVGASGINLAVHAGQD